MHKELKKKIDDYLNDKTNEGIFVVTGEWGSGKTYFVKKCLEKNLKNVVYISLFGFSNIEELATNLFWRLSSFPKKTIELFSSIRSASIQAFGFGVSFSSDQKKRTQEIEKFFTYSGKKTIVFDDFERSSIDKKTLLGFIYDLSNKNPFSNKKNIQKVILITSCKNKKVFDANDPQEKKFDIEATFKKIEYHDSYELNNCFSHLFKERTLHSWITKSIKKQKSLDFFEKKIGTFTKVFDYNIRILKKFIIKNEKILNEICEVSNDDGFLESTLSCLVYFYLKKNMPQKGPENHIQSIIKNYDCTKDINNFKKEICLIEYRWRGLNYQKYFLVEGHANIEKNIEFLSHEYIKKIRNKELTFDLSSQYYSVFLLNFKEHNVKKNLILDFKSAIFESFVQQIKFFVEMSKEEHEIESEIWKGIKFLKENNFETNFKEIFAILEKKLENKTLFLKIILIMCNYFETNFLEKNKLNFTKNEWINICSIYIKEWEHCYEDIFKKNGVVCKIIKEIVQKLKINEKEINLNRNNEKFFKCLIG